MSEKRMDIWADWDKIESFDYGCNLISYCVIIGSERTSVEVELYLVRAIIKAFDVKDCVEVGNWINDQVSSIKFDPNVAQAKQVKRAIIELLINK